ncbi:MAG: hypothetical protein ACOC5D_04385 [Thermoplasmatota archaeon]
MFSYTKEQTTFELKEIKVGGLPGQFPTLMVGTVFYEGQFKEPKKSTEDVKELIRKQKKMSEKTSIPSLVDFFIYEKDEVEWKIDFALENIEGYFSLDMPESEVRIEALKYLDEQDALSRVIYNSFNLGVTEDEIEVLEERTPSSAIVLAYNPQNNNTQGRLDILKDGGNLLDKGLLTMAQDIGIEKTLLDTAATPFGEGACEPLRSIPVFKSELGLPVGCALHNTVEAWQWLEEYEDKKYVMDVIDTGIDGLPILLGADFIYYGPIENSRLSFPYIAMVDKLIAEGAEDYFGQDIDEDHPYHKLL